MVSHNNKILSPHFNKNWMRRVKCWFNQPMRHKRRRITRQKKAARIFPRPVSGLLRPIIRCSTVRYNMKLREGRGFTVAELKEAKISPKVARTIGIAVDFRRTNKSEESLRPNVERLKLYKSKLLLFPRRAGHMCSGDARPKDLARVVQYTGRGLIPFKKVPHTPVKPRAILPKERKLSVYERLRMVRRNAKLAKKIKGKIRRNKLRKAQQEKSAAKKSRKAAADE
eukprot:TRINITY_DN461_c0_g1_i4.p2 TRINITY_DN461_c0_g1~~TRINITY_DN461_c0_g1_i4.p2  ORF type:complete len:226 (+),score=70.89 TRINITY_DN461_c0_g1_i4:134-811(+)